MLFVHVWCQVKHQMGQGPAWSSVTVTFLHTSTFIFLLRISYWIWMEILQQQGKSRDENNDKDRRRMTEPKWHINRWIYEWTNKRQKLDLVQCRVAIQAPKSDKAVRTVLKETCKTESDCTTSSEANHHQNRMFASRKKWALSQRKIVKKHNTTHTLTTSKPAADGFPLPCFSWRCEWQASQRQNSLFLWFVRSDSTRPVLGRQLTKPSLAPSLATFEPQKPH